MILTVHDDEISPMQKHIRNVKGDLVATTYDGKGLANMFASAPEVRKALELAIDFKEMGTQEFVDKYGNGVCWGDVVKTAREAMGQS